MRDFETPLAKLKIFGKFLWHRWRLDGLHNLLLNVGSSIIKLLLHAADVAGLLKVSEQRFEKLLELLVSSGGRLGLTSKTPLQSQEAR